MDTFNKIDWYNHDGVNLPMINDFMRNQFYDRVLSRYVAGKHCTDVGFGTGLLTMIALKHGAAHVRAFESDYRRYQLGVEIVRRLNLESQVELINDRYDHKHTPTPITFSETVNGNLWWEGLWNSLPVGTETKFLPGEYFLELWATAVPNAFAQGLTRLGQTQQYFSPGIDLDSKFINVVNSFRNVQSPMVQSLSSGIVHFERQQETDWGWIPYMRAVQAGSVIAKYTASNTANIEEFVVEVDTLPWKDQTLLIVPRMGMEQDTDRLYLDTGHWGPGENPVLLVCPQQKLLVKHNVKTGIITYSLE